MDSEKQRVDNIIDEMIQAKSKGKKIKYDRDDKVFTSVSPDDPDIESNKYINVNAEDMDYSL